MKVSRSTPDRLVLEHRPRTRMLLLAVAGIAALTVGAVLAIVGSWLAVLPLAAGIVLAALVHFDFPAHASVTLDRRTGQAEVIWLDGAGITRQGAPLGDIAGAEVETIRSHEGPAMDRAVLITPAARIRLTRDFHEGPAPATAVAAINAWLGR
ncbi:hypothetical protein [Maritimibacter sp. UBA3975]|uniref:hypothetical protein n=1 Tax=Maritimibacter sp. UBA3975 TaxID=1946833 RepID=UPI000C09B3A7|nr:hypothetical protein [Maritimibacter sp. UBA3975]MAM62763.1 hypothetical protein [Maritimibacter sp.]|tara:strand:- start:7556 stop:8014 length:459 start_codon:yes stop_codon:yes gene_type:complete